MAEQISKGRISSKETHRLASYILDGKFLTIERCSFDDIPVHSGRVYHLWTDPVFQYRAMIESVEAGCAYKLQSDAATLCFLYAIPQNHRIICGMSFWCKLKCHAVIGYMFMRDHTRFRSIHWSPYKLPKMPLSWLLDERIITDYHNGSEFVGIRIPDTKLELLSMVQSRKHSILEV